MIPAHDVHGPADAPVVVLLPSLGSDRRMWAPQVGDLAADHRVVAIDTRGHGASPDPDGESTLADLGGDVVELLDHLDVATAHVVGCSLGGITGLWLARYRSDRVRTLTVANSAARVGSTEGWTARIEAVTERGLPAVAADVLPRLVAPSFDQAHPAVWAALRDAYEGGSAAGYSSCCAALRDADLTDEVTAVTTPTLVVGGTLDQSTPPAQQRALDAGLPTSRLVVLDGAAHLANLDQPSRFTAALREHLGAGPT